MVLVSATRLRVKSVLSLPQFFIANQSAIKKLKKSTDFLGGAELIDKNLTFWMVTMWTMEISLTDFRYSSPHNGAMEKLPKWCAEASYINWIQKDKQLPDWKTVNAKMLSEGKTNKDWHPASNHAPKIYSEIKWNRLERNFNPVAY